MVFGPFKTSQGEWTRAFFWKQRFIFIKLSDIGVATLRMLDGPSQIWWLLGPVRTLGSANCVGSCLKRPKGQELVGCPGSRSVWVAWYYSIVINRQRKWHYWSNMLIYFNWNWHSSLSLSLPALPPYLPPSLCYSCSLSLSIVMYSNVYRNTCMYIYIYL